MKNISIPPFYVGQEVVAVRNGNDMVVVKDKIYRVLQIKQSSCCGKWVVDIGVSTDKRYVQCECSGKYLAEGIRWARASLFAPITSTFQPITLEKVLEEETKLIGVN